ncbi:MAG: LytTR family DNA-binding domain-containing protein, partial [Parafilimonas sp.]
IIDDEPLARKGLKEYISEVEFLHLAGEYDDALKALPVLNKQDVQLILLDIQMPRLNGLDFLRTLAHPPLVIITTAYPQHALEGFDFNRFLKAVMKAKEHYDAHKNILTSQQANSTGDDYLFIKSYGRIIKILYADILFVEALQNYVTIHTPQKKYITYLTFKSVEDTLPKEQFVKVHKSFIVQISKVNSIEGNILYIHEHEIPISRNLKDEVMQKILADKYLKR